VVADAVVVVVVVPEEMLVEEMVGNDNDGLEDARLQNCCARFSALGSSSCEHWEVTQDSSSIGNRGLESQFVRESRVNIHGEK
jgi:hypothetical protein